MIIYVKDKLKKKKMTVKFLKNQYLKIKVEFKNF